MTESKGYLYAFLCSILTAFWIVLIKWVQETMPPQSVLFLTQAAAALALTLILLLSGGLSTLKRQRPKGWAWLIAVAALTYFAYWTLFEAIDRLDPTVVSFLGRAETLVTILFGVLVLRERLRGPELGGAAMVIAGVVVIRFVGGVEVSQGFALCIAAAVCWGITEGLAKIAVRYMEPLVFTWGRCMLLAPVFFITASADGLLLPPTPALWAGVIGIALVGPVLARYLYMKSLTLLPVSKAALVNQLQPVWVALVAGIALQSIPTLKECIGGIMIIAGCMLLVRKKSQH